MSDTKLIDNTIYRRYKPIGSQHYLYLADGGVEGHIQAWDANMIPPDHMAVLVLWELEHSLKHPITPHLDFNRR